jgi:hypothetical protein
MYNYSQISLLFNEFNLTHSQTIINQALSAKPNMEMGGSLCWWEMETITSSNKGV